MGCRKGSPFRNTEYSCPGCTPLFSVRSMKSRSPSAATTRPSAGGKAPTTSWIRRPKVAPTWSAVPAPAGPDSRTTSKGSAITRLQRRGRILKDHRGLVDAEHPPQRVADLAEGHLRPHRAQDMGQQVVAAPRGPVHRLEGPGGGGPVAGAAHDREALGQGLA